MRAIALLALATAASYGLGMAAAMPALVPFLNAAAAIPFMYGSLARQRVGEAIARMLVWAAVMGLCATTMAAAMPGRTSRLFVNAESYRAEMFDWVRTGAGAESDPARFVPQHLFHATLFCGLSAASGGVLSMPMGAALMNYMGDYVGALASTAGHPARTILLAWHPWALIRIVSFVILGVVLSGPVLSRLGRFRFRLADERRWIWIAAAGLVADLALKALAAPIWRTWLVEAVGW
jgi:hypothetical protein